MVSMVISKPISPRMSSTRLRFTHVDEDDRGPSQTDQQSVRSCDIGGYP